MAEKLHSDGWHSVSITLTKGFESAAEHALLETGASGTAINQLKKEREPAVTVIGYFDHLPDADAIRDAAIDAVEIMGGDQAVIEEVVAAAVADQDWLAEWKKHWKPTRVGSFVIAPPWEEDVVDDGRLIRIEPNMAFGTGTHETTKLCLSAIDKLYEPGQTFLDVGTGTGVLIIAAAIVSGTTNYPKMVGIDTDGPSVEIAIVNSQLNGVGDQVEIHEGTIDEIFERFDFVCANVTLDVILPILKKLVETASRSLVLSGILTTQRDEIERALTELGKQNFEIDVDGEWLSVTVVN